MNKSIKEISPQKANKFRLLTIMMFNFMLGSTLMATILFIQEYISNGLFHKIVILFGGNIPIGIIIGVITVSITTSLLLLLIGFDYMVFKYGIEFIKIDGEKKN